MCSFQEKYGDLDSSLISYGPCQTPTLGFCVDRHDKIQTFQPQPYWVISPTVSPSAEGGSSIVLSWEKEREFDINRAKHMYSLVKAHSRAKVISLTKKEKSKPQPQALNTVELLRICSSNLSIGPHQTMQIAERLYMQGYISYPRTETTQYPNGFSLLATLELQRQSNDWGNAVSDLLRAGIVKPRGGKDVGDHPPITPMKCAGRHDFDTDMWRVYEYIVRHFIGSLAGEMKYQQTTAIFTIGDEKFSKQGSAPLEAGFTTFMPWLGVAAEERIPSSIKQGDEFYVINVLLNERKTAPPDYLSEADLITLMEKHGIGTDASIPTHINNISMRNYVKVSPTRRLIPTRLGIVLVHGYQKIDSELVLPTTRAALEQELNQIALGKMGFEVVLKQSIQDFRKKFHNFTETIAAMDELFQVSFSKLADSGKPISR